MSRSETGAADVQVYVGNANKVSFRRQGFRRDFGRKLLGALPRGKDCARRGNQQERRNEKLYLNLNKSTPARLRNLHTSRGRRKDVPQFASSS